MQRQSKFQPTYSFEFFPPKTEEGAENLLATSSRLARLNPDFFSVTFGAGGSTREKTFETVMEIQHKTGMEGAPHLSCIGSTRDSIRDIINQYRDHGIKRIVALRGDMPSGMMSAGEFQFASELVAFIRQETGDHFSIEVAAYPETHPEAANAEKDLIHFKRKVEAGANSAITQYFYSPEGYFYFVDACEKMGIDLPITPGIMPITNYTQLSRFSERCGAEIPRWMRKQLESFGDDRAAIRAFGIDVVSHLCQKLLDNGAPGLHFYTMNRAEAVLAIWQNLNLTSTPRQLKFATEGR